MRKISRRKAIHSLFSGLLSVRAAIAAVTVTLGVKSIPRAQEVPANSEKTKETWLKEWFESKPPEGALHLFRFADEVYVVTKQISWIPSVDQRDKYKRIDVPVGFVTDLASVPRIFWQTLPRDGKYTYPAIVHDYMYWLQDQPRENADEILRIGMEEFGLNAVVINAVYWGVKAGGSSAWSQNAALKAKGEKRVLKRFPDDPLTRWEDWKKLSDVLE